MTNNFSLQRPVSIQEHLAKMYFIAFLKVLMLQLHQMPIFKSFDTINDMLNKDEIFLVKLT